MRKTVAVVLATYNGEKYIAQQLQSIVEQSYPVTVVYIVDDGSKDSTMDICRKYKSQHSSIKWVIKENHGSHGTYENFCYGLRLVENSADYVALCDQDDVWPTDRIAIMLSKLDENKQILGLASTFSRFVDDKLICEKQRHPHGKRNALCRISFKNFCHFHEYLGMSMIFRNEIIVEFNKFAEILTMPHKSHDIILGFFSVLFDGFYYLDVPLTKRRSYSTSSSNTLAMKEFNESGYHSMKAYAFFIKSQYMTEFAQIASKYNNVKQEKYYKKMSDVFFSRATYVDEKNITFWLAMGKNIMWYDSILDYIKDLYKIVK